MNLSRKMKRKKAHRSKKVAARPSITPEQAYYVGHCEQLAFVIGFLRDRWGFGAKLLQRFADEFSEFAEDMDNAGVTGNDIGEAIKDETGWDMFEAFPSRDVRGADARANDDM